MEFIPITTELFESLVLEKAKELRLKERTKCIDKWEAMQILGVKERTFYKLLNSRESLIRRGAKNGTFIEDSIYKERDKKR